MTRNRDNSNNNDKDLNEFLQRFENDEIDINEIINSSNDEPIDDANDAPIHRSRRNKKQVKNKADEVDVMPGSSTPAEAKTFKAKTDLEKSITCVNGTVVPTKYKNRIVNWFMHLIGADDDDLIEGKRMKTDKVTRGKKIRKNILTVIIVCVIAGVGYSAICIATAPKIDADDIYSILTVSSTLYDDQGKAVDNVFSDQNRTIIDYDEMPDNLVNAFVSLEDKTFWKHHGFNIVRIFGAIKDAVFTGSISGTSTITQQLARNVYLQEDMSKRSLKRKIVEAYYTMILESHLSKQEIITAYLNTINLGFGCYGVEAASEAYFDKEVKDLNLEQCAALAAIPQAPTSFALIVQCNTSALEKTDVVLTKGANTSYILNDLSKDRRETCLALMLKQERITQAQYDKAIKVPLKKIINPSHGSVSESGASYYADYVIDNVINDLMEEYNYSEEEATEMVYSKGLQIYTTMDSTAQSVVEKEFENQNNFPGVTNIKRNKKGNIVDDYGNELLFAYDNYFDSNGVFKFKDSEYKWNDDGSLTIYYGKRLNIYETASNGTTDYSIEFKKLYTIENNRFFAISGGYINIPAEYKTVDADFNVTISSDFFKEHSDFFNKSNGLSINSDCYTLNQKVVQPQGAMVIRDVKNGQIKAMIGGREINGQLLFNRATAPRQPGSSIKPLAVYSAALQEGYELVKDGKDSKQYYDVGGSKQGTKLYGNFLTAASVIDDEPIRVDGRIWPQNSYSGYHGIYSMRNALKNSVNVCAVKIFQQLGADYSSKQVKRYGITTLVDDEKEGANDLNAAALALGGMTKGVSPLEMSNAYTAFANGGKIYESSCYTKVVNKQGETLLSKDAPKSTEAIDEGVSFIMRDMMFGVVSSGTGTSARVSGVTAGGKTGTTTDQYDIWFDGFTPSYSASLWIGNDVNMELTSMSGYAAALWGKIMNQIPNAKKGSYPSKPDDVISVRVDSDTGYLPGSGSKTKSEYFIKGTQPTEKDVYHKSAKVCSESGYLATPWCTSLRTLSGFRRPYNVSGVSDKKSALPKYYCNVHNLDPEKYPISPKEKLKNNAKEPEENPDPDVTPDETE